MTFCLNVVVFLLVTNSLVACNPAEMEPVGVITATVPVAVPCIDDPPPRPQWLLGSPDGQTHLTIIRQALHDALVCRGYASELEAALTACQ